MSGSFEFVIKIHDLAENLSNLVRFKLMLSSFKSGIKNGASKVKNSTLNTLGAFKRKISRHRWRFFKVVLVLGIIAMVVALVMQSFMGVDISQQSVIINHTEERITEGTYSNQIKMIGLNSQMFILPKRKFLLYFGENQDIESGFKAPSIHARVQEGTKVMISARVSCQILTEDLKLFLEDYGLDWPTYILEKAKNVIIQRVSTFKFYDLNNKDLLQSSNEQLASIRSISGYPFKISLVSVKIKYPKDSYSGQNTMGISLLEASSLRQQLGTNYEALTQKINSSTTLLQQIAQENGFLQAQVTNTKLQMEGLKKQWLIGLSWIEQVIPDIESERKFMWKYFQNLYNSTYVQSKTDLLHY